MTEKSIQVAVARADLIIASIGRVMAMALLSVIVALALVSLTKALHHYRRKADRLTENPTNPV
jgi:hypothetical protein